MLCINVVTHVYLRRGVGFGFRFSRYIAGLSKA
jgi:hypothetical protein